MLEMKWLYRLGIGFYQKVISPRKGYRCPEALEHGGPGCSGAVLAILERDGLIGGYAQIRQRFLSCSDSAKKRRERHRQNREKDPRQQSCLEDACCSVDCGECLPALPRHLKPSGDCAPDCGDLGCGHGCDLSLRVFRYIRHQRNL